MKFKHIYGITSFPKDAQINYRPAVRAVVLRGDSLLMVHNSIGDYKFPGGGVDKDETMEEALRREVLEETGYTVTKVGEKLGETIQNREDMYKTGQYFSMTSHYYLCEVANQVTAQKLDNYEQDLQFTAVWVTVTEALANNIEVIKRPEDEYQRWAVRETEVLKEIQSGIRF
jgi:8-oxo-dGTP pyrophosphatase MutT (NUDIX family)